MTTKEVKASFKKNGVTFSGWAKKHGFDKNKVSKVLNGQFRGNYGEAFTIATMLGLKDGNIQW